MKLNWSQARKHFSLLNRRLTGRRKRDREEKIESLHTKKQQQGAVAPAEPAPHIAATTERRKRDWNRNFILQLTISPFLWSAAVGVGGGVAVVSASLIFDKPVCMEVEQIGGFTVEANGCFGATEPANKEMPVVPDQCELQRAVVLLYDSGVSAENLSGIKGVDLETILSWVKPSVLGRLPDCSEQSEWVKN